jgi:hypothetical protein
MAVATAAPAKRNQVAGGRLVWSLARFCEEAMVRLERTVM